VALGIIDGLIDGIGAGHVTTLAHIRRHLLQPLATGGGRRA